MTRIIRTLLITIVMVASCVTAFAQQPNRQQRVSREQLAEIEPSTSPKSWLSAMPSPRNLLQPIAIIRRTYGL